MPTRNVSLTPQLDSFVEQSVAAGTYQNASEVVREALRLLLQRDARNEAKLARLRQAIKISEDEYARGEYVEVKYNDIGQFIAGLAKRD